MTSTTITVISHGRRIDRSMILSILHEIIDPGVPRTLEEMGIVSRDWIHIEGEDVRVEFRPTSHICPVGLAIGVVIKEALERELEREVKVRMLRGSHLQESLVNDLLDDRERYERALERLRSSGFIRRCQH